MPQNTLTWRGNDRVSNYGTATLLSGQTTITVTHDLGVVPDLVLITAQATNATPLFVAAATITDKTFVITSAGAAGTNIPVFWMAARGFCIGDI